MWARTVSSLTEPRYPAKGVFHFNRAHHTEQSEVSIDVTFCPCACYGFSCPAVPRRFPQRSVDHSEPPHRNFQDEPDSFRGAGVI